MLGGFFAISKSLPPYTTTTTTTIPALYYNFFSLFSSILKYKRSPLLTKKILNKHDEPKIIYDYFPLFIFSLYLLCPKEKKIQNNSFFPLPKNFHHHTKIYTSLHSHTCSKSYSVLLNMCFILYTLNLSPL